MSPGQGIFLRIAKRAAITLSASKKTRAVPSPPSPAIQPILSGTGKPQMVRPGPTDLHWQLRVIGNYGSLAFACQTLMVTPMIVTPVEMGRRALINDDWFRMMITVFNDHRTRRCHRCCGRQTGPLHGVNYRLGDALLVQTNDFANRQALLHSVYLNLIDNHLGTDPILTHDHDIPG